MWCSRWSARGTRPAISSQYAFPVGVRRARLTRLTVEFKLERPNPIFLQHIDTLWIMSKAWSEKHKVTKPLDFKNKEESHASLNANGTGPYMMVSRQPAVKVVLQTQPELVGPVRGQCAGDCVHADCQRRHAAGGAAIG